MADPAHIPPAVAAAPEHHSSTRYWLVWVALLILTVTTYSAAKADLGSFQLPVAMVIALTKASLVVLFFMHMAEQKGASRLVFAVSLLFVVLMISVIWADVGTRFPLSNPPSDQAGEHGRLYRALPSAEDEHGPKPQPGGHPYH